ncbi:preprotein translocase subunit SecE [Massilibacterium senegalense]|uniref:preprotein translocase subunit SecE n=1 Tax=Massilibacterium senegalense TaxID=1632858 RepID=UPI000780D2CD|nr:preprotein translocase subunit SecE [Massilibacterium senegalense]
MADFKKPVRFLGEVKSETKKVSWPKREELTRYTVTVLLTVIFFAAFFALVDFGLSSLVGWITK